MRFMSTSLYGPQLYVHMSLRQSAFQTDGVCGIPCYSYDTLDSGAPVSVDVTLVGKIGSFDNTGSVGYTYICNGRPLQATVKAANSATISMYTKVWSQIQSSLPIAEAAPASCVCPGCSHLM